MNAPHPCRDEAASGMGYPSRYLIAPMIMPISVVIVMSVAVTVVFVFVLAVVVPVVMPVLFVHFVAPKVLFPTLVPSPIGSFTPVRIGTPVPKPGIEAAIHIRVKTLRAMKPGTCTDKGSSHKPLRSVIAERRASIWRIVEVAIRTNGGHSNIDGDLRHCLLSNSRDANSGKSHRDTQLQSLQSDPPDVLVNEPSLQGMGLIARIGGWLR